MIPVFSLWLPILLAAVFVFVASSLVHMVLRYHKNDFRAVRDEEPLRAALGAQKLGPGQYMLPFCTQAQMKDPAVTQKYVDGPVAIITMFPNGQMKMGKYLLQWFIYCLGVCFVVGYLASRVFADGAVYVQVFRFASVTAWLAYTAGNVSAGIWQGRPWSTVAKDVLDAAIYGLLTGGAFAGLWPR
jgi:hypothetical protein